MLLIGYFEGLEAERAIAWRAADSLALREFLGKAGIDLDRLRLGEDTRQFNYDLGYRYADLNQRDESDLRRYFNS